MLETHGEIIGSSRRINHSVSWHNSSYRNNTGLELQLEQFRRCQERVDDILTTVLMVSSDGEVLLFGSRGVGHAE